MFTFTEPSACGYDVAPMSEASSSILLSRWSRMSGACLPSASAATMRALISATCEASMFTRPALSSSRVRATTCASAIWLPNWFSCALTCAAR